MFAVLSVKRFFLCRVIIWVRTQYNTVSVHVANERISNNRSRLSANTVKAKAQDAIITIDIRGGGWGRSSRP